MLFFIIIAGIVQGLTEFLPVSSSAHLAILEEIFSIPKDLRLSWAVFFHFGTFLALLFFFSKVIVEKIKVRDYKYLVKIIIASLPLLFGIYLKELASRYFSSLLAIGYFLMATGFLLFLTRFAQSKRGEIRYLDALVCGLFQLISVFPGISRSGATVSILLLFGIKPDMAFEFSFLLSLPAILGATLYEVAPLVQIGAPSLLWLIGVLFAFLFGYLALYLLQRIMVRKKFYLFAFYLFLLGMIIIIIK